MAAGSHPKTAALAGVLRVDRALGDNAALGRLLQRLQDSRARFAAIRELLPDALRTQVRPGPLDDAGWTLLVPGGAAAAKLRQLQPLLADALRARGLPVAAIRVRIRTAGSGERGAGAAGGRAGGA